MYYTLIKYQNNARFQTIYMKNCIENETAIERTNIKCLYNEAVKQELEEAYQVDFEKMGTPAGGQKGGWGFNKVYISPERAKRKMADGTFGKSGMITPREFVRHLKGLGYSDEQIQAGIQNGAIKIGKKFGSDNFLPHNNLRKQNRRNARLNTVAGLPVNQNDIPNKELDEPEKTFDGGFPWDNTEPVWTPKKPKTTTPATTPTQSQEQQPAQPEQPARPKVEPIIAPVNANIPAPRVTGPQAPGLVKHETQPSIAQSAVRTMGQTANQSTLGLNDRRATNKRTKQNAINAINQAKKDGAMTKDQARNDKKLVRNAEKSLRKG